MTDMHGIDPAMFDKIMRRAIARIVALRHANDGRSDEVKLGMMEAALHLSDWRREVEEAYK
jgi:hypothetical protein